MRRNSRAPGGSGAAGRVGQNLTESSRRGGVACPLEDFIDVHAECAHLLNVNVCLGLGDFVLRKINARALCA
jgi:hypothetical protein